jgi:hypothetical protein
LGLLLLDSQKCAQGPGQNTEGGNGDQNLISQ